LTRAKPEAAMNYLTTGIEHSSGYCQPLFLGRTRCLKATAALALWRPAEALEEADKALTGVGHKDEVGLAMALAAKGNALYCQSQVE